MTIDCCSMKRRSFEVDSERLIDKIWFLVEDLLDIGDISFFNVPEEVLIVGVTVGDAFYCSH